ncbi:MAG: efflux RND transporter periplasmic adaptor subunit, partial [Planctomycetota bacterium]|nr:efflux RND transporter periplasmic adaptor subunit [Planctomycetota bacterium]
HTEAGQWLETGTMVVTLLALDDVDAVFPVPERDAARLKRGAAVDVYVPALGGKRFQGTLNTVVPQADLRGRTFPVKIRVNNTLRDGGPVLMAGMVARAAIGVGEKTLSLLVPKDAVVLGGPSPTVYVVSADGSVRPVPVELGAGYEAKLVVKGALKEGDVVVVRGNERLQPGQKVKARS